jgi:phage replication-related protein YjqB (UPF0714/DUF867 family)
VTRFADLLAAEGVVEVCELRSARIGFLALHGGLEATTYEIARTAAATSAASLYAVVQPDDLRWHVPSHRYETTWSESLAAFCAHVDVAISLHGYGGVRDSNTRWTTVLLGGSNRGAAVMLADALRAALPDYAWIDDIDRIPSEYRGLHPGNPVNATREGGVQIELPPRIRGTSPIWEGVERDANGFVPHTATLVATLASFAEARMAARSLP